MIFTDGLHANNVKCQSQERHGTCQCREIAQMRYQISSRMVRCVIHSLAINQPNLI
jgi:hypothetical protein